MAQFDVHRLGQVMVVDCQADLLSQLETRLVVPLASKNLAAIAAQRLNPTFDIADASYVMMTQQAATVPRNELGPVVVSLADRSFEIMDAIDVLLSGV